MSSPHSHETPPKQSLEPAHQSDEALLENHSGGDRQAGAGAVVSVLFAFLLCFAGIYLERGAGDYSARSYNEDARSYAASGGGKPKAVDMVAFGKKQYASQCITCHGASGTGQPGLYPPLAGSEWVNGSEEKLVRIVLHGLTGPITVAGQEFSGAVQMPSFGKVPGSGYNWRDDQIAAVLTYIRQEWGNKGAAVTTEKVAEIRTKETRSGPWTVKDLELIP